MKTKFRGFKEGLCSTFISFSGTVSCTHVKTSYLIQVEYRFNGGTIYAGKTVP